MAGKVTLLSFWASVFGIRVQIALAEKGIEYEYIEQDLMQKSDLLVKMNPVHKKIPVLIHNGEPICESLNIVQYIDEVWNDKSPLLPEDPYKRAVARFWADFVDKKAYDFGMRLMMGTGEDQEKGKNGLLEAFKLLEGELGDKAYFGGDSIGYVDVALIPYYSFFYAYEKMGNFSIEAECPKLVAWTKKCLQKESVSKHVVDQRKAYDLAMEYRKKMAA